MKKMILLFVISLTGLTAAHAQNYELKVSSLIETCSFIHKDEFSFKPMLNLIQEHLKVKLEGDKECTAPLGQLKNQLFELDQFFAKEISEKDKKKLMEDAQKQYLVDLQTELMTLNPADPDEAFRISSLQGQMDAVRAGLTTMGVETSIAALEDRKFRDQKMQSYWKEAASHSSTAIGALNALPDRCVDKLGGWQQLVPVILDLASLAGPAIGGAAGPIVSLSLKAGSQLAVLLQNTRVKRAITATNRLNNQQIIACSYLALQSNACELKRAKIMLDDKDKIDELINQQYKEPKYAEYEKYFFLVENLPKIQMILNNVGAMGSALTLDLSLLIRLMDAMRMNPNNITYPDANADDSHIMGFLIRMRALGIMIPETNNMGLPLTVKEQLANVITTIENAKLTIETVTSILTSSRSFIDLKDELITRNRFIKNELRTFKKFIVENLQSSDLPTQYRSSFVFTRNMVDKILDLIDSDMTENEAVDEYRKRIDKAGTDLFIEMSYASVAQITSQTVLMIPGIAFERFNRPFRALEHYYVSNDIIKKDDPEHVSFTDYVIKRSVQLRLKLIPDLNGSGETFRIESHQAALRGLERGFQRDIIRMVKDSMGSSSQVLDQQFEGKTAAHVCALFSSFLEREAPKIHQKCLEQHKELKLNPILAKANRPSSMKINYQDPCFYNDYKREENGQRRLFETLIDYGMRHNMVFE
jgi:hypothetical protein